MIAAVDMESFYDDECSVRPLGTWHYCRHPKFRAYGVSIVTDDGLEWYGPPEEAPWDRIDGAEWVSHNMSFDRHVYETIAVSKARPSVWNCTADLSAWAGLPRSLAGAVQTRYGRKPDKSVRDRMKGKMPEDLTPEQRLELVAYALDDARWCLKLWQDLAEGSDLSEGRPWPEWERRLSRHTAEMGWHGVPVVPDEIAAGIRRLSDLVWEAQQEIPWTYEDEPPLSAAALARACVKAGIAPPASLAMDSDECSAWEDEHGERFPWVRAMRQYRRCNMLLQRLITMQARVKDDGRMGYGLKYAGAHTRRWSGDSGVNLHNLPRKEMFGVDLRSFIKAPEGKTLVVVDLSQIEPRCLAWLAGDKAFLDQVRQGSGVYEAFARSINMWSGDKGALKHDNPPIYQTAKAMVLGCGYGAGAAKFCLMAPMLTGGAFNPDFEQAEQIVARYRKTNPKVTRLWDKLERGLKSKHGGGDFTIELPSGNIMRYRQVSSMGGTGALTVQNGKLAHRRLWGSKIAENITQAMARDVFADGLVRILDAGHKVILHVHDEVVVECGEGEADAVLQDILNIMSTPPSWAPDLPVGAEGHITKHYTK